MIDHESLSRTFPARSPEPHVHLDNRTLIVHDGTRAVRVARSSFPWIVETLQVIVREGRASRSSGQIFAGGFSGSDDSVTLYFGTGDELVSVALEQSVFASLLETLEQGQQRPAPRA